MRGVRNVVDVVQAVCGVASEPISSRTSASSLRILSWLLIRPIWKSRVLRFFCALPIRISKREQAFLTARNRSKGSPESRKHAVPSNATPLERFAQPTCESGWKSPCRVADSPTPSWAIPARSVSVFADSGILQET